MDPQKREDEKRQKSSERERTVRDSIERSREEEMRIKKEIKGTRGEKNICHCIHVSV